MAGLLSHLGIAFVGLLAIYFLSKKWSYGWNFSIGHLIPDLIKFGITGIKIKSLNPSNIIRDSLFLQLEAIASNYYFWIVVGVLIIGISLFLRYLHKIKKRDMTTISKSYIFFLAGVFIHLIIDILIIEKSYWI